MAPSYKLWRSELKEPTPEAKRLERTTVPQEMSGFYMIDGARTKPAWPVAIWTAEGEDASIFQVGRKVMRTDTHPNEWADFASGSWTKCIAVEQKAWEQALETGRWADGRPAREITEAERADIIPTTSADQGGNAPVDENGEEVDAEWEQIKANLERDMEALKALGMVNSLEVANKGAAIIERMRANGALGERKRKAEKAVWDAGAAKVQTKFTPTLNPASAAIQAAVAAIDKWKKAEEKRLAAEAEAKRREEAARIAAEREEQLRQEAAERARQAEQMGMDEPIPTDEEIAEQAAAEAAQQVAEQMPEADTKVRVGTAHGRAVSKPKIKRGVIDDIDKFFAAIKDHDATKDFLQQRANAIARAGVPAAGMHIEDD